MPISITCTNGHRFQARETLAGKRVPCPKCREPITIPTPKAVDEPLPLSIEADVPTPLDNEPVAISDSDVLGDSTIEPLGDVLGTTPLPALAPAPRQPSPSSAQPATNKNRALTIGLLLAGGLAVGSGLAIFALAAVWLLVFRTTTPPEPVAADATPAANSESDENTLPPKTTSSKPKAAVDKTTESHGDGRFRASDVEEKLKRIGYGLHNHHDKFRAFVPARARDSIEVNTNRRTQLTELSWRVHILPYIDQLPLYERFHIDEPWDSPHNLELVEHMPEVFRLGNDTTSTTRFQVLTGPNMLFGQERAPRLRDVKDGTRHTIMVIVLGTEHATTWTKPDEFEIDPKNPVGSLGTIHGKYIPSVATDARILMIPKDIESENMMALATPAGKEIIDADRYRSAYREAQHSGGIFGIFGN